MNYKQLVTPNLDPVVYQGGVALNDWLGWCLAVAWTAFGGKTTDPTAWSAWTNSVKYKHTDALPSGVYVPIWFSGYGGSGHVAIYKDGTVWSSPYTHKTSMDVLSSIAQVEKYYGVTYVGWSEDIGSVRVVEPLKGEESMTKAEAYTYTDVCYRWGTGEPPTPELSEYWAARISDPKFPTAYDELYQAMKKSAEASATYTPYSGSQLFTKKG